MKRKRVAGVFLLTAAVLAAAASMALSEDDTTSSSAGAVVSIDQAVASIPPDEDGNGPFGLEYAYPLPFDVYDPSLLVTLHAAASKYGSGGGAEILRIWKKEDRGRFRLLKKLATSDPPAHFGKAVGFRAVMGPTFVFVPCEMEGTGHLNMDDVFAYSDGGAIDAVEFQHAPEWFKDKLRPGEGIWKGERNRFSDDGMTFEFEIWKKGDSNCCPTAGQVRGEYKIVRTRERDASGRWSDRYEIEVSTFTREPIPERPVALPRRKITITGP